MNVNITLTLPTNQDCASLLKPPPLMKTRKTTDGSFLGAKYTKVIRMAKNPTIWRIRVAASKLGKTLAPSVVTATESTTMA